MAQGKRNDPTVEPTGTDYWYLAGFIDGEGCITVRPGTFRRQEKANGWQASPFASLTISQVDPRPLQWCQARWGGALRPLKRRKDGRNDRNAWEWCVVGRQAQRLFEGVRDMLKCKQEACDNAMRMATLRKARGHHNGLTPAEIAVHQEIIAEARRLNSGTRDGAGPEWHELPGVSEFPVKPRYEAPTLEQVMDQWLPEVQLARGVADV
jgi:hypothetical protein